jgi:thiol-disulfide isomerase/thioredoxin
MKPAWDQLGDEFKDSSVVIADADCTIHKEVCEKFEVRGYPTIKYFVDGEKTGKDYSGGRDFDSLKKFVDDNLVVLCQLDDPSECDAREVKYIEKMKAKGASDIAKQLERLKGMTGKSMKADLKQWLHKRLNILEQLSKAGAGAKEEL